MSGDAIVIWLPPGKDLEDLPADDDSVGSVSGSEAEEDDNVEVGLDEHLVLNAASFKDMLAHCKTKVKSCSSVDPNHQLITTPTASKLKYNLLHPLLYRPQYRIDNTIHALAKAFSLKDVWRDKLIAVENARAVQRHWSVLFNLLPDSLESEIEAALVDLIGAIAYVLDLSFQTKGAQAIAAGGMFPDVNYAAHGKSDSYFTLDEADGAIGMFITEVKRATEFKLKKLYYGKSLLTQALLAMYSKKVPVLVTTQQQFKVIWPATGGTGIDIWPPSAYGHPAYPDLLAVLVILLLYRQPAHPAPFVFRSPIKVKSSGKWEMPTVERPSKRQATQDSKKASRGASSSSGPTGARSGGLFDTAAIWTIDAADLEHILSSQ